MEDLHITKISLVPTSPSNLIKIRQLAGSKVTALFLNFEFGWDFSIWVNFMVVFRGYHPQTLI
jgi:hypothetical protein